MKSQTKKIIGFAVLAVMVILLPKLLNNYSVTVLNASMIYAIAVLGLSLLLGMGGMMSFATVTFMGIGAYSAANLAIHLSIPTMLCVLCAIIISVLIAWALSFLMMRLKNAFFSFATIGLVQVFYSIFLNFKPLTGGPNGLGGIPKLSFFGMKIKGQRTWFYVLCGIVIVCGYLLERIRKTSLGRSLAAIRDSELVAQTQGVNIYRTKRIAFMISAAYGGLAGAVYAFMNSYLSAYLFTYDLSIKFLVMIMLGGINSTIGAIVGAISVNILPELFRVLSNYMKLIYGLSIILLMVFMPSGLAGICSKYLKKYKKMRETKRQKDE